MWVFFSLTWNFDRLGFPLIGWGNTLLILAPNFYCSCLKIEVLWSKKITTVLDHCPFISEIFFPYHGWRNMSVTLRRLISSALLSSDLLSLQSFNFTTLMTFTTKMTCFAINANCFTSNLIIISVRRGLNKKWHGFSRFEPTSVRNSILMFI